MSGDKPEPDEPPRPPPADEDDFKSAADDPTAMWDEGALRAAGMSEIAGGKPTSLAPAPATGPDVKGDARESVVVGGERERTKRSGSPAQTRPSQGLSWPATVALALALGAVVYFVVRLFK